MSDLISRSALIDALKVHFDSCFREDGELLYSDHICTSDDVVDLIKLVENQPTAYDIDKVVKELYDYECEIINYCIDNFDKAIDIINYYIDNFDKAIEIVKVGRKNEIN